MPRSVRAVFWDFGGVITSSPFEAFNRYEETHGLPRDFLRQTNAVNPDRNAWARFERNEINAAEFDALFFAETTARGHAVPGRDILPLLAGFVRPEMVRALKRVKRDFRIACLTNNIATGYGVGMSLDHHSADTIVDVMSLFDFVLESSKAGVRKPERRFYEIACEALSVQPTEVVYLDDLGINLKPARDLGMHTIKVGDPRIALAELQTHLGIDLND